MTVCTGLRQRMINRSIWSPYDRNHLLIMAKSGPRDGASEGLIVR